MHPSLSGKLACTARGRHACVLWKESEREKKKREEKKEERE